MRHKCNGCAALLLALSIAIQPLEARGRKSGAGRGADSLAETSAALGPRSVALRQDAFSASASSSAVGNRPSAERNGKPASPLAEQPSSGSNPLHLKLGAMTLQPAVGVKGVQFSIGF